MFWFSIRDTLINSHKTHAYSTISKHQRNKELRLHWCFLLHIFSLHIKFNLYNNLKSFPSCVRERAKIIRCKLSIKFIYFCYCNCVFVSKTPQLEVPPDWKHPTEPEMKIKDLQSCLCWLKSSKSVPLVKVSKLNLSRANWGQCRFKLVNF